MVPRSFTPINVFININYHLVYNLNLYIKILLEYCVEYVINIFEKPQFYYLHKHDNIRNNLIQ